MTLGSRLVEEKMRELAARGATYEEAAAELGTSYSYVASFASRRGIEFKLKRRGRKPETTEHHLQMKEMYLAGKTLNAIGQQFDVTRERVRQILSKKFNMTGADGGKARQVRERAQLEKDRRDKRCLKKLGCSYATYLHLLKSEGRPTRAFNQQRKNAKSRGIEWKITFYEWWKVWEESGHWGQRGRGMGYCMCRFNDAGPYAVGNVYIATGQQNSLDYWSNRRHVSTECAA